MIRLAGGHVISNKHDLVVGNETNKSLLEESSSTVLECNWIKETRFGCAIKTVNEFVVGSSMGRLSVKGDVCVDVNWVCRIF